MPHPQSSAAGDDLAAAASGAESGRVTACTSAGITLGVAACMTGNDLAKLHQLPDATGMPRRVLIQKGHCVDYGAPVTQAIRLAGAEAVEVGTINRCTAAELRHELNKGHVAAILAVESHHPVLGYTKSIFNWSAVFWLIALVYVASGLCWLAIDTTKPLVVEEPNRGDTD